MALRPGSPPADLEAARRRARHDPPARLRVVLPHRRRHHRDGPRPRHPQRRPRVGRRQPGQLPARHLRDRPPAPRPADGAVPLTAAGLAARHRHRRGVSAAAGGLRRDPGALRPRALRDGLDDGHLQGAARDPRRRGGAGDAGGRDRHHRQGVPAHPRPRRPDGAARPARAARDRAGAGGGGRRLGQLRPVLPAGGEPRRAAAPHRDAPVRGAALRPRPCWTGRRWSRASWATR